MATQRRAEANWEGSLFEGSGRVSLTTSSATQALPVTWKARTEDAGGKTSPEELIAAAHAACLSMALANQLAQNDTPADRIDVRATCTFDKTDAGFRITTMDLEVTGKVPGIDPSEFEKLAEVAKDGCPVSNALSSDIAISLKAALDRGE